MAGDLSRKTVLMWDASGSYTHMAEAVVNDFARVLYYVPWETGFPVPANILPGEGVDGIERLSDFWNALETADLVVFADVGNYGLQEYLRRQNIPVFGSGSGGALEHDRVLLKSTCEKLGIDVAKYA